jgi:hypothetical protein
MTKVEYERYDWVIELMGHGAGSDARRLMVVVFVIEFDVCGVLIRKYIQKYIYRFLVYLIIYCRISLAL